MGNIIIKENSQRKLEEPEPELQLSQSLPKQSNTNVKEFISYELPKAEITGKVCDSIPIETTKEETETKKDIKIVAVANPVAVDQNCVTESGDEDANFIHLKVKQVHRKS